MRAGTVSCFQVRNDIDFEPRFALFCADTFGIYDRILCGASAYSAVENASALVSSQIDVSQTDIEIPDLKKLSEVFHKVMKEGVRPSFTEC